MKEAQEEKREFIIGEDLVQDVLNYLAKQPFEEVVNLINAIQSKIRPYEPVIENPEPKDGLKKVK